MRPANLKTKIFLDSGDPKETREIIDLLGFLDGQTTNPTLIAKNPQAKERMESGKKFTRDEVMSFYKDVVTELSGLIPEGSISIEVDANAQSDADKLFEQGKDMYTWIPNAHIKYPTTTAGLEAAELDVDGHVKRYAELQTSSAQALEEANQSLASTRDQLQAQIEAQQEEISQANRLCFWPAAAFFRPRVRPCSLRR